MNFAGKARGYDDYPSPDNYAVGPTVGLVKVNGQIPLSPPRVNVSLYLYDVRRRIEILG